MNNLLYTRTNVLELIIVRFVGIDITLHNKTGEPFTCSWDN